MSGGSRQFSWAKGDRTLSRRRCVLDGTCRWSRSKNAQVGRNDHFVLNLRAFPAGEARLVGRKSSKQSRSVPLCDSCPPLPQRCTELLGAAGAHLERAGKLVFLQWGHSISGEMLPLICVSS